MSKFLENIPNDIEAKPWPPLLVRKRHRCACDGRHNRHDRWCTVLLIALLIYLVADTIVLNVAIVRLSTPPNNATATLAAHTQQCLSQYALNAPINPSAYPCAPCLTLLQAIPQNLSFPDPQDAQQAQNAIQFCALKAVFDSAGTDGKNNLGTVGWLKDVRFCVWNGVACDGSGRVSSLCVPCV